MFIYIIVEHFLKKGFNFSKKQVLESTKKDYYA